ncbi:MAG: hypothetical protein KF784_00785 [Fimbriimonadaceae bacterium]|nr:hypothetical protein [Fimbriimonadaceae bacterium]
MTQLLFAAAMIASSAANQPFTVRYAQSITGHNVSVSLNGNRAKTTFAGKLGFQDQNRSWMSYCAQPGSPIRAGQFFQVRSLSSAKQGGNVAKAGNIVAKFFSSAQTADQCAGLQLAIWEAVEDGGDKPHFLSGRFQARASEAVIAYAEAYYDAIDEEGDAIFLQSGGDGQDQITT